MELSRLLDNKKKSSHIIKAAPIWGELIRKDVLFKYMYASWVIELNRNV